MSHMRRQCASYLVRNELNYQIKFNTVQYFDDHCACMFYYFTAFFLFGNKQISRLCKNVMAKISNPPRHIKATTQHKTFHLTSLNIFSLKSGNQAGKKTCLCHRMAKYCFGQWRTKSILGQRTAKTIFISFFGCFEDAKNMEAR